MLPLGVEPALHYPSSKQHHQAQYFYLPSLHREGSGGGLADFMPRRGITLVRILIQQVV